MLLKTCITRTCRKPDGVIQPLLLDKLFEDDVMSTKMSELKNPASDAFTGCLLSVL